MVMALALSFTEGAGEPALTLHVSVDGDDAAAGTEAAPLGTLPEAQQRVREHLADDPAPDVEVVLHEGVHRLTD